MRIKVITIGSDSKCDFVINSTIMPTLDSFIIERILPIHAQILQVDNEYYLKPFSDYIYINGCGITSNACICEDVFSPNKDADDVIKLDIEDHISVGVDIFWQQWMFGLGLCCDKCGYKRHSIQDDGWCKYCKERHFNPEPYIYGYSSKFNYAERNTSGFYNYTNCEKCNLKPDWCLECNFFFNKHPKNNSYKEHVHMYIQRLEDLTQLK